MNNELILIYKKIILFYYL